MKRTNAWEESVALNRPKARIHSAFAVKGAANTLRHARCAPLPSRIHKVRIALQAARYNSGLKTWVRKPCEMTEVQPRSESGAGAALTFSNTHDTWTSSGSQRLERAARPHARQVLRRTRPPDECDSHKMAESEADAETIAQEHPAKHSHRSQSKSGGRDAAGSRPITNMRESALIATGTRTATPEAEATPSPEPATCPQERGRPHSLRLGKA